MKTQEQLNDEKWNKLAVIVEVVIKEIHQKE